MFGPSTVFDNIGNWLHGVWFGYFWPSLLGNGPEDILAFIVIGGGLAWLGKWALTEWHEHKDHIHAKLDHIITSTKEIDNHVPGMPEHRQPKAPPAPVKKAAVKKAPAKKAAATPKEK